MSAPFAPKIVRRQVGDGIWLGRPAVDGASELARLPVRAIEPEVLPDEAAVGEAQWEEIKQLAAARPGDLVIVLLGGRGAQALHSLMGRLAESDTADEIFARLNVFTQDALAPLPMNSALSFVRDFERLLGPPFFRKVKSFTPIRTDTDDAEGEMIRYVEGLEALGGIDLFFLGLGPEAEAASHLAYIKPGSGATGSDVAGVISISSSILEHHISKFKAGGSAVSAADEAECRRAKHILTLGPAAILGARRVVQSIVDAGTAPAKRQCYRRVLNEELSADGAERAAQLDANPGLWLRVHPSVRSLVLPDVLAA